LTSSGALDELFARIDAGEVELAGREGLIQQLIKAGLERGLQAELSDHLGYERGDPAAGLFPNSRNGSYPKTVASQVGDIDLDVPRDRQGSFTPTLVPKGSRRLSGLVTLAPGGAAHSG
jgi:transposase-like protein